MEIENNYWRRSYLELREIFPDAQTARCLIRSRVVTDPTAVLSVRPGIETVRPAAVTPIRNLFLAGDWTQTGWPSTMEVLFVADMLR